ncbi:MAG: glycosyltransferase family 4 protein [Bacteroidetes bacterium]|nr:glycosyltransferase family 4 protein [Bacteroidota bacterium]
MKKVLIVAAHRRDRSPNQRFRFEQYTDFLAQNGFQCELSSLISPEEDKFFYKPGHYLAKARTIWRHYRVRRRDLARIGQYDLVMVVREAMLTGSTFFEQALHRKGIPAIYDFDDSIWLQNVSAANRRFAFLKDPDKTRKLIGWASLVFAGNEYLADYARQFNDRVVIIPTTIDTNHYRPAPSPLRDDSVVTLGWSGSISTIQHFEHAIPFLREVKARYGDRIRIKVIGDGNYRLPELGITGLPWRMEDELDQLRSFDIGIMPLPDDEWAMGKCGLKGLQYMALEIPTLMSPVGVNAQIIQDGANGFLATEVSEWVDKIGRLIEDASLRKQMGAAARQTVLDHYSVHAQQARYLQYFQQLTGVPVKAAQAG